MSYPDPLPDAQIDDRPGDPIWLKVVHAALREAYAVCDHLTIAHRSKGCNPSCDWWARVEAIRKRNKPDCKPCRGTGLIPLDFSVETETTQPRAVKCHECEGVGR